MFNLMRITVAVALTVMSTIIGFVVGEPALGLLGLLSAVLFLKADWSR